MKVTHTVPQAVFDTKAALKAERAGHDAACRELGMTPRHLLNEGNPNHPNYDKLFGYDQDVFLARQYRV